MVRACFARRWAALSARDRTTDLPSERAREKRVLVNLPRGRERREKRAPCTLSSPLLAGRQAMEVARLNIYGKTSDMQCMDSEQCRMGGRDCAC